MTKMLSFFLTPLVSLTLPPLPLYLLFLKQRLQEKAVLSILPSWLTLAPRDDYDQGEALHSLISLITYYLLETLNCQIT